jgi:fluoride exporter
MQGKTEDRLLAASKATPENGVWGRSGIKVDAARKLENMSRHAVDTIDGVIWVSLGGVLGGIARFWLSGFVARRVGETFPWGTMVINVSGAFLIGVLAASAADQGVFAAVRPWQFAVTGFLGCYTTVSSFSLQTLSLARDSEISLAAWNLVLSVSLCLVAVAAGFAAGHHAFG